MRQTALLSFVLLTFTFNLQLKAQSAPPPFNVAVNVSNVYIPDGFDTGSDVFVVISGTLPSECFRWSHAEVTNLSSTEQEVRTYASQTSELCTLALVPFSQEVHLGSMAEGLHVLHFIEADGTSMEKLLRIRAVPSNY